MKGKAWASWLLAGMMAFGQGPAVATASVIPATQPEVLQNEVSAQTVKVLTRAEALKEVKALRAIHNASLDEREAFDDWQNAVKRAEQLDTEKFIVRNPFTGEDMEITYSDKVQLQLRIQKYWLPDQLEQVYRLSAMGTALVINTLENTMDSLLLALHAAQTDIRSKERARVLASQTLVRTKASLAAGRVIQLDVDADALALKKAEAALAAAERARDNLVRNYNRFVGMPLEREIQVSLTPMGNVPLLASDDYVLKAMEHRLELFQARGNIPLKEEQAELMTFKDLYLQDPDIRLDREAILLEWEQAKAQLPEKQRAITAEIRAAYLRMKISELEILSTRDTLAKQKAKLTALEAQMGAGRLPAYADDALRAAIADIEAGIVTARLSLDNDVRKFRQATVYGPAVQ